MNLDEALNEMKRYPDTWDDRIRDIVPAIATEVQDLKREIVTLKLLIEHEETVRVTKAGKTRTKSIAPKFKVGDRVLVDESLGTIQGISKDRVQVDFGSNRPKGTRLYRQWVAMNKVKWAPVDV